jgi:DNA-binding SARP family transcriptional activator
MTPVATREREREETPCLVQPPLVFGVLGGFHVQRGGWELDDASWGRPLVGRLTRFLLIHRATPVPHDVLFETFWRDKDPAAARRNLCVAVSLARKALDAPDGADSVIQTHGRSYQLRLRPGDVVDSDEFEAAAAIALAASGPVRRSLLEDAEALWSGAPLPEDRYAEWTFEWRERLSDRYAHVIASLIRSHARAGQTEDAMRLARKYVALDPLNEAAQQELMTSYARAGRRHDALRQFLACRRALVDQLGIEPCEETTRLQQRILAGEAF